MAYISNILSTMLFQNIQLNKIMWSQVYEAMQASPY